MAVAVIMTMVMIVVMMIVAVIMAIPGIEELRLDFEDAIEVERAALQTSDSATLQRSVRCSLA